jgi:hypothetical protein
MRILGPDATLTDFRLDLVHLASRLRADKREPLQALAPRVEAQRTSLLADRGALEDAEDQLVAAGAIVSARDADLDDEEKRFALAAKLAGAEKALFPVAPSKLTNAPLDEEIQLVRDQLAKLAERPADDDLRVTWEPILRAALDAVVAAKAAKSSEQSDLAVARSRVAQRKTAADSFRVEVWGSINALVQDKAAADAFFRSRTLPKKKAAPGGPTA